MRLWAYEALLSCSSQGPLYFVKLMVFGCKYHAILCNLQRPTLRENRQLFSCLRTALHWNGSSNTLDLSTVFRVNVLSSDQSNNSQASWEIIVWLPLTNLSNEGTVLQIWILKNRGKKINMVILGQVVCFSYNGQISPELFIFCPFILGGLEGDLHNQKSKVLKKIMSGWVWT